MVIFDFFICFFLSCINAKDEYACKFADGTGPQSVGYGLYVTWINPNSKKTRHLLQANDLTVNKLEEENKTANQTKEQKEDGEKEIEVVKDVYNKLPMTSENEKIPEKSINRTVLKHNLKQTNTLYNNPNSKLAEYKKLAKEALASKKAITPLLLIIIGVSCAFVFVFLRVVE